MRSEKLEKVLSFTLIELLVVIAIIAILAAMLMPALEQARRSALAVSCRSRMHQMGLAVAFYRGDFDDYYPVDYLWGGTYPPYGDGTYRFAFQVGPYLNMADSQYTIYTGPDENLLQCPDNGWGGYEGSGGWSYIRQYTNAPGPSLAHNYLAPVQFGFGYWSSWVNFRGHDYRPKRRAPQRSSSQMLAGEVAGSNRLGYVTGGISPIRYFHPGKSTNVLITDLHVTSFREGHYGESGITYLWNVE